MFLMIRQNPPIKGILVKDNSFLLSQFADDATLYLDGKEESFRESVNVLVRFAPISGLKINFDKINAVGPDSKTNKKLKIEDYIFTIILFGV